jgi:hypothetical protein
MLGIESSAEILALIPIFIVLDELVRQSIDQQATDWNIPLLFPRSHHPAKRNRVAE